MKDRGRDRAFGAARRVQLKRRTGLIKGAIEAVQRHLEEAGKAIRATLERQPSDYKRWYLTQLAGEVDREMARFGDAAGRSAAEAAGEARQAGIDLVDVPIRAGLTVEPANRTGLQLMAALPAIDQEQLLAMQTFMVDRLKGVGTETARKIRSDLGLVVMGVQAPEEAVASIARVVDGGRARATAIVRTEVGRAYSVAAQERQLQATDLLPGLKKQWRRSGKRHSRVTHDLADGQIRKPAEAFDVGGRAIMHPRDPKAPPGETINCGCESLPMMASWEVTHPGAKPHTPDELANPGARQAAEVQERDAADWAAAVASGEQRATGEARTIGSLAPAVSEFLARKGVDLVTRDIGIGDRQIAHMFRPAKQGRGQALPASQAKRLADVLGRPKAVLWEGGAVPQLLYLFEVPGEQRLGKLVVKLRDRDKRLDIQRHNWIVTGGLVDGRRLGVGPGAQYELVMGEM
ncbi:MAG: hypothetical protein J0H82_30230 [Alphaproteobacteria bacterium]|nr:hypothetical protein [Alphaproteobacteria bacterium]